MNKSAKLLTAITVLSCSLSISLSQSFIPALAQTTEVLPELKADEINKVNFELQVSKSTTISPPQRLEELVKVAIERDEQAQALNKKANTKFKTVRKVARRVKSMAQFATAYQGFASSSEAADVILSEKLKLKHAQAVEYVRQKQLDELHSRLFVSMMQIAQGLGINNNEERRQKVINSGMSQLEKLVGKEEADKTLSLAMGWAQNVQVPAETFQKDSWDVMEVQDKSTEVLKTALKDDSVVKAIEARLHKFNHRSNFARATSKIVNTGLSVAMFSPTLIAPAAQVAQLVFVALTGGPEEEKLLKEVYLDRCFESRFNRLQTEAALAVNNYNMAILTKNPALLLCSESLLTQMVGRTPTEQIVGQALLPAAEPIKKTEVTLKPEKVKEKKSEKTKTAQSEMQSAQ